MSVTDAAVQTDSRKRIRIFVNGDPLFATAEFMTGAEILALAGLPGVNHVFLDVPGSDEDERVPVDKPFHLRPGMKFYDVPVGTFG